MKRSSPLRSTNHPPPLTPDSRRLWALFFFFILVNALLSYLRLPLVWDLWIGLFGFLLPAAFLGLSQKPASGPSPILSGKWGVRPPLYLLALAALAILALRVFKPFTFISWPLYDETVNAYYALGLDQEWSWRPSFFFSQIPPLFIWLLTFLFKGLGSFLTAIRLEPILLSLLILPAAYGAARVFFSRSFSVLYVLLVGLTFWSLFFGRISHQGLLLVLWEYLTLACLGKTLKTGGPSRLKWLVLLGALLGTGFYTYFSWPLVAVWIGGMALWTVARSKKDKVPSLLALCLPLFASLTPYFLAFLRGQGSGSYYDFLFHHKGDSFLQVRTTFSCLASFLWGCHTPDFYYGPVWGGFFNPLLGAALVVGTLMLLRRLGHPESLAFFLGVPLFLLPAFITNSLTDMREIQLLPLLTFAAALGLGTLAQTLPSRKALVFLAGVLTLSTALDLTHLLRFGDFINGYWEGQKTAESALAFRILDQTRLEKGPGLVLTSYSNDVYTYDQSLLISTYPFNAALNPRLSPDQARWLAVVTNVHFRPFLTQRFPDATMVWLSKDKGMVGDNFNGGLMLVTIPWTEKNRVELGPWVQADKLFRKMSAQVMDLPIDKARREILHILQDSLATLPQDPFLRSCYWEMVYFNFNWENLYGDQDTRTNFPAALNALEQAVQEGYPTAYFYNELGSFYALKGDTRKARACFEKAIHSPLNLTPAVENLKALEAMNKKTPK